MKIKITKADIAWNYAGTILNIAMSSIILPVILHWLSSVEIGLWYVFANISSLISLIDFGFSPTIMRNISYAWSGAKQVKAEGFDQVTEDAEINYNLLSSLIISSKRLYLYISLVAFILSISVGSFYINSLLIKEAIPNKWQYLIAWIIYAIAIFINLYYSYWPPLLKGVGNIKDANKAIVISKVVYIVLGASALLIGGGLIGLSLVFLVSGFVARYYSKKYFFKRVGKGNIQNKSDLSDFHTVFKAIWPNSRNLGIVTIGAWLITKSTTLICSSFFGLTITAQYGLSLQLFNLIFGFSSIAFSSFMPEIASLKMYNDKQRYLSIFSLTLVVQWVIGILGSAILVLWGPRLLSIIHSNSQLLPTNVLILLAIVLFLEQNHSTFATFITMDNTVPFVKASIISGIAIVVVSILSIKLTHLGIIALILSQGMVQLAYNNWYWPVYVIRKEKLSFTSIISNAINYIF